MRYGWSSRPTQITNGCRSTTPGVWSTSSEVLQAAMTAPSANPIHWFRYWGRSWSRTAQYAASFLRQSGWICRAISTGNPSARLFIGHLGRSTGRRLHSTVITSGWVPPLSARSPGIPRSLNHWLLACQRCPDVIAQLLLPARISHTPLNPPPQLTPAAILFPLTHSSPHAAGAAERGRSAWLLCPPLEQYVPLVKVLRAIFAANDC